MLPKLFALTAAVLFMCSPAQAEIHKCVSTDGKTSYSDTPCATAVAEKSVDSSLSSIDQQQQLGHLCAELDERRAHCGNVLYPPLFAVFREHCANPILLHQREVRQPAVFNRYQSNAERNAEAEKNRLNKPVSDFRCEMVQMETWEFLKDNFGKKLTAQTRQDIDYNTRAVPVTNNKTVIKSTTTTRIQIITISH